MSNQYREQLLAEYARLTDATESYNAIAKAQGWPPITGVDTVPGPVAASVDPVGEIREDGSAFLPAYQSVIDEYAASDDPWQRKWATEREQVKPSAGPDLVAKYPNGVPVARPYGMLPEIAQRAGLTDKQRSNILRSCGLTAFLAGDRHTGQTDREFAAKSFVGFDYSQGLERIAILDCHAYPEAKPQSGFAGAKLADVPFYAREHAKEWIRQAKLVKG